MLHHQFDDLVAENWGQNTEGFANTVSSFTEVLKVWKNTTLHLVMFFVRKEGCWRDLKVLALSCNPTPFLLNLERKLISELTSGQRGDDLVSEIPRELD